MFFGLTIEKVFLLGVIGALVIGPDRLPELSRMLARGVQSAKSFMSRARERARDEMGPEIDDVDWKQLDPRQFDPRRIIREALLEPDSPFHPVPPPLPPDSPAAEAAETGTATPDAAATDGASPAPADDPADAASLAPDA